MRLDVYLNYSGNCEEAFRFYEKELHGTLTSVVKHSTNPNPALPAEWNDKVLHARLELPNAALLGADIPTAQPMRSAYVTLTVSTAAEAERLYEVLASGGEIFMKLQETFFATRFAMLRDRFGTSWMLLAERQQESLA